MNPIECVTLQCALQLSSSSLSVPPPPPFLCKREILLIICHFFVVVLCINYYFIFCTDCLSNDIFMFTFIWYPYQSVHAYQIQSTCRGGMAVMQYIVWRDIGRQPFGLFVYGFVYLMWWVSSWSFSRILWKEFEPHRNVWSTVFLLGLNNYCL